MKKQKKVFTSLILCAFFLFSGSMVLAQDRTAEQKEVWAAIQANWEAIKNGDVKAAMAGRHDKMLDWFSENPDPLKKKD